jgi:hypothetical protein
VYQENLSQDHQEELLHVRNLIGEVISPVAESCLMILKNTDVRLLRLLSISGASELETLHTAKSMSNGNVKSFQEMKRLMENVSGTMATLEPSSF